MEFSPYKLAKFLKDYINPKRVSASIGIRSRTAQTWVNEGRFDYIHCNF